MINIIEYLTATAFVYKLGLTVEVLGASLFTFVAVTFIRTHLSHSDCKGLLTDVSELFCSCIF